MKLLAVVAARGGSKGLPDKNLRHLSGKPLITYTIEQMKRWGKYDKFIVSTDSREIADIAVSCGAEVPFMRPAELADDNASKVDALRHALSESERYYNMRFDALLDLDVTAPIRTIMDIDNIIRLFREKKADTVFSVVKAHKNPYFNMVEKRSDGTVEVCKPLPSSVFRRQAAPVVYEANASIYVYSRRFLLKDDNKTAISDRSFAYEMDEISAVDIDREIDFKFIEFLIEERVVKL